MTQIIVKWYRDDLPLTVDVADAQALHTFQRAVEDLTGVPVAGQKLMHNGRYLKNNASLAALKNGSVVQLVGDATKAPAPAACNGVSHDVPTSSDSSSSTPTSEPAEGAIPTSHVGSETASQPPAEEAPEDEDADESSEDVDEEEDVDGEDVEDEEDQVEDVDDEEELYEDEEPYVRRRPNSFGGGGFFGGFDDFSSGGSPFGDPFFGGGFGSPFGARRQPQPRPRRAARADDFQRRRQSHPQRSQPQRRSPQPQPQPQAGFESNGRSIPRQRPTPPPRVRKFAQSTASKLPQQQQRYAPHPHNIPSHFSHQHRAHEHPTRSHDRVHSQQRPPRSQQHHAAAAQQSPAFEHQQQPDPNKLIEEKFLKECANLEPRLAELKSSVEELESRSEAEAEAVTPKEILVASELIMDIEVALDNLELPKVPAASAGIVSTPESPKPALVSDPALRKRRKALIDLAEDLQSRLKVVKSKRAAKAAAGEEVQTEAEAVETSS